MCDERGIEMNYRILSKMSCRIISIYAFVKFIMFFQSYFYVFYQNSRNQIEQNNVLMFLPFFSLLFLSIILWVYADKISQFMVKESENSRDIVKLDYVKLQAISFSVVGVVILTNSIPEIIKTVLNIKLLISKQLVDRVLITYKTQMIGYGIKIIMGLWLLFGASGIVGLIKTLRTVGVEGPDEK